MANFSKSEAIKFGWGVAKNNWKLYIPLLLLYVFLESLGGMSSKRLSLGDFSGIMGILGVIIAVLIRTIVDLGFIKIALNFVGGQKSSYSEVFSQAETGKIIKFFVATLLYGLLVAVGTLALIIPGIYFAVRFQYYAYFIVDKNVGIFEAFSESSDLTKGVKMNLLLFNSLNLLINIAGVLALGVGLFWSIPTTMVSSAFVFRKLQSIKKGG